MTLGPCTLLLLLIAAIWQSTRHAGCAAQCPESGATLIDAEGVIRSDEDGDGPQQYLIGPFSCNWTIQCSQAGASTTLIEVFPSRFGTELYHDRISFISVSRETQTFSGVGSFPDELFLGPVMVTFVTNAGTGRDFGFAIRYRCHLASCPVASDSSTSAPFVISQSDCERGSKVIQWTSGTLPMLCIVGTIDLPKLVTLLWFRITLSTMFGAGGVSAKSVGRQGSTTGADRRGLVRILVQNRMTILKNSTEMEQATTADEPFVIIANDTASMDDNDDGEEVMHAASLYFRLDMVLRCGSVIPPGCGDNNVSIMTVGYGVIGSDVDFEGTTHDGPPGPLDCNWIIMCPLAGQMVKIEHVRVVTEAIYDRLWIMPNEVDPQVLTGDASWSTTSFSRNQFSTPLRIRFAANGGRLNGGFGFRYSCVSAPCRSLDVSTFPGTFVGQAAFENRKRLGAATVPPVFGESFSLVDRNVDCFTVTVRNDSQISDDAEEVSAETDEIYELCHVDFLPNRAQEELGTGDYVDLAVEIVRGSTARVQIGVIVADVPPVGANGGEGSSEEDAIVPFANIGRSVDWFGRGGLVGSTSFGPPRPCAFQDGCFVGQIVANRTVVRLVVVVGPFPSLAERLRSTSCADLHVSRHVTGGGQVINTRMYGPARSTASRGRIASDYDGVAASSHYAPGVHRQVWDIHCNGISDIILDTDTEANWDGVILTSGFDTAVTVTGTHSQMIYKVPCPWTLTMFTNGGGGTGGGFTLRYAPSGIAAGPESLAASETKRWASPLSHLPPTTNICDFVLTAANQTKSPPPIPRWSRQDVPLPAAAAMSAGGCSQRVAFPSAPSLLKLRPYWTVSADDDGNSSVTSSSATPKRPHWCVNVSATLDIGEAGGLRSRMGFASSGGAPLLPFPSTSNRTAFALGAAGTLDVAFDDNRGDESGSPIDAAPVGGEVTIGFVCTSDAVQWCPSSTMAADTQPLVLPDDGVAVLLSDADGEYDGVQYPVGSINCYWSVRCANEASGPRVVAIRAKGITELSFDLVTVSSGKAAPRILTGAFASAFMVASPATIRWSTNPGSTVSAGWSLFLQCVVDGNEGGSSSSPSSVGLPACQLHMDSVCADPFQAAGCRSNGSTVPDPFHSNTESCSHTMSASPSTSAISKSRTDSNDDGDSSRQRSPRTTEGPDAVPPVVERPTDPSSLESTKAAATSSIVATPSPATSAMARRRRNATGSSRSSTVTHTAPVRGVSSNGMLRPSGALVVVPSSVTAAAHVASAVLVLLGSPGVASRSLGIGLAAQVDQCFIASPEGASFMSLEPSPFELVTVLPLATPGDGAYGRLLGACVVSLLVVGLMLLPSITRTFCCGAEAPRVHGVDHDNKKEGVVQWFFLSRVEQHIHWGYLGLAGFIALSFYGPSVLSQAAEIGLSKQDAMPFAPTSGERAVAVALMVFIWAVVITVACVARNDARSVAEGKTTLLSPKHTSWQSLFECRLPKDRLVLWSVFEDLGCSLTMASMTSIRSTNRTTCVSIGIVNCCIAATHLAYRLWKFPSDSKLDNRFSYATGTVQCGIAVSATWSLFESSSASWSSVSVLVIVGSALFYLQLLATALEELWKQQRRRTNKEASTETTPAPARGSSLLAVPLLVKEAGPSSITTAAASVNPLQHV